MNDLLNITNDRIQRFARVDDKVWDTYFPLKGDHHQMVARSQGMRSELINLITERGRNPDNTGTDRNKNEFLQ